MKITVQRKVEIWVEDVYEVEKINEDNIEKAINYDIDSLYSDTLWDTLKDLGPVEVYDEDYNLIAQREMDLVYE